jgi:hypothetical protein
MEVALGSVTTRTILALAALAAVVALLAGCGGSGSHTYVMAIPPTGTSGGSAADISDVYVTIISPARFPDSVIKSMQKSGARLVDKAAGPQVCSYKKKISGVKGQYASLNGKTVTLKVNGVTTLTGVLCSIFHSGEFNPTSLEG